jgi:hypothetical protein
MLNAVEKTILTPDAGRFVYRCFWDTRLDLLLSPASITVFDCASGTNMPARPAFLADSRVNDVRFLLSTHHSLPWALFSAHAAANAFLSNSETEPFRTQSR